MRLHRAARGIQRAWRAVRWLALVNISAQTWRVNSAARRVQRAFRVFRVRRDMRKAVDAEIFAAQELARERAHKEASLRRRTQFGYFGETCPGDDTDLAAVRPLSQRKFNRATRTSCGGNSPEPPQRCVDRDPALSTTPVQSALPFNLFRSTPTPLSSPSMHSSPSHSSRAQQMEQGRSMMGNRVHFGAQWAPAVESGAGSRMAGAHRAKRP